MVLLAKYLTNAGRNVAEDKHRSPLEASPNRSVNTLAEKRLKAIFVKRKYIDLHKYTNQSFQ